MEQILFIKECRGRDIMAIRFRKSKSKGPFRFTLGKKSFSSSVGGKTFRVGLSSTGKMRVTSRIPGTGISFSTSFGGKSRSKRKASHKSAGNAASMNVQTPPRPAARLRTSNSVAVILFVVLIISVPAAGVSLSWNGDFLSWFIKFIIYIFALYMIINNVSKLRSLVQKWWNDNKLITGVVIAACVVGIAVLSAIGGR
jgi:hypothetical protein